MAQPDKRPAAPGPASVPDDELAALMILASSGDQQAFGRLYDLVSEGVFGLIVRVLRDRAQAQEVLQEVMLEIWRTTARFDDARGSTTSWIMTIAHRRAVDRIRAERASARRTLIVGAASIGTPYDAVLEEVTDRLDHQQVRTCLKRLTALQQQAITLAYYQGHTYQEVADLLTTSLPTVKTRMRNGLIRLRDCLTADTIR